MGYVILLANAFVELYIDRGLGAEEVNKTIFEHFYRHKTEIETALASRLTGNLWRGNGHAELLALLLLVACVIGKSGRRFKRIWLRRW